MSNCRALRAILTGGVVVGVLDISSAFVIWWQRGVALQHGLQGIAAGLVGTKSFEGGMATAGLGLALHFFVAFVVMSVFYLASRRMPFLTKQPFVWGVVYGIGVYLVMYWIVLPLGILNISTPAVERVARAFHSHLLDRLAHRIHCAPVL